MTAAGTRARVRAALTREIVDVARRHLGTEGPAGLSLRAVARELGMASSAVYRYFPSRDDLLTALIVEAYDALGDAAEQAETAVPRDAVRARFRAVCAAVRGWARAHPHEYALVYGSPVPGYAAPEATIGPAARVGVLLAGIVGDALSAGVVTPGAGDADAALAPGVPGLLGLSPGAGGSLAARAIDTWTALFGLVSFELFGQFQNVVEHRDAYFAGAVDRMADGLGLPPGG